MVVGLATPAAAATRTEVRKKRAEAAAKVSALRASDAQLTSALATLQKEVNRQEALAASASQAAAAARQRAAEEKAKEKIVTDRLNAVRSRLRQAAINAYTGRRQPALLTSIDSINTIARRTAMINAVTGSKTDLADQLNATRKDLLASRQAVEAAQARAEARRRAEADRLNSLKSSRSARQRLANDVEARLEAALAEADSLAAIDKKLADDIARRQASLARSVGPSSRGRSSQPVGNVSLTTVRGITVASSIADNLDRMLSAADGDGVSFGGQGYRSSEGQAAARRRNCGSSDYDVYQKPASQCSPPTARPGQSMHEQGLAIDFTYNGALIRGRSGAGYQWLKNNAARFGLYNLPSESWHWSVNGN